MYFIPRKACSHDILPYATDIEVKWRNIRNSRNEPFVTGFCCSWERRNWSRALAQVMQWCWAAVCSGRGNRRNSCTATKGSQWSRRIREEQARIQGNCVCLCCWAFSLSSLPSSPGSPLVWYNQVYYFGFAYFLSKSPVSSSFPCIP